MFLLPIRKLSKFSLPAISARDRPIADQIEKRPPNFSEFQNMVTYKTFALALFELLVTTKKWEKHLLCYIRDRVTIFLHNPKERIARGFPKIYFAQ